MVGVKGAGVKPRISLIRGQGRTENVSLVPLESYGITGLTGSGKDRQCLQPLAETFSQSAKGPFSNDVFICISYIPYNFQYTITLSGDFFLCVCFFNSIYLWVVWLPFL